MCRHELVPNVGSLDINTVKTVGPVKVSPTAGPVVGRTLTRYPPNNPLGQA
jgi:hypothetical protein